MVRISFLFVITPGRKKNILFYLDIVRILTKDDVDDYETTKTKKK